MKYNTISTSSVTAEGKKSTFTCYTDEEDVASKVNTNILLLKMS